MKITSKKNRCKHERARKILPNLFECKICGRIFGGKPGLSLYISDDDNPDISVITVAQAGIIATKVEEIGSIINLDETTLTHDNFSIKISELPSLSVEQKLNLEIKLKDYGFNP